MQYYGYNRRRLASSRGPGPASITSAWLFGYRTSKHFPFECESFVLEGAGIVGEHVSGQAPPVHRMDPMWVEFLDPVHHPANGLLRGKYADLLIEPAHHLA